MLFSEHCMMCLFRLLLYNLWGLRRIMYKYVYIIIYLCNQVFIPKSAYLKYSDYLPLPVVYFSCSFVIYLFYVWSVKIIVLVWKVFQISEKVVFLSKINQVKTSLNILFKLSNIQNICFEISADSFKHLFFPEYRNASITQEETPILN